MNIRPATIEDLNEIMKLAKELDDGVDFFKRLIKEEIVLVAIWDGIVTCDEVVGVVYGEYNKKEKWTELRGIVVCEQHRGWGMGTTLIKAFEKKATGTIEVFAKEDTLAKLLPKLGYKKQGVYINFIK